MRKFLFFTIFLVFWGGKIFAQDAKVLKDMENLTKGMLPNGITYYLVQNKSAEGFCSYYLLQKAGTVNEADSTRGFADIISEMRMHNSVNFPDGRAAAFLDRLEISPLTGFSADVGAYSSLYSVRNVRTSSAKQDSILLFFANLASWNTFTEDNLSHARDIVRNDFLLSGKKLSPDITVEKLSEFYSRYYGSDNLALVIVGDMDSPVMEMKIRTLFQIVPFKTSVCKSKKYSGAGNDEISVTILPEENTTASRISFEFYADPLPERYRLSAVPYVLEYMNYLMTELIEKRLLLQSLVRNCAVQDISVRYLPYEDYSDKEVLRISLECEPGDAEAVFGFAATELERIRLYGFRMEELKNISETFLDNVNGVKSKYVPNDVYARKCIKNYLYSYSLSGPDVHKSYLRKAHSKISLYDINTYVRSYIKTSLNTSAVYRYPASDTLHLTEYKMTKILEDVQIDYSIGEFNVDKNFVMNFRDSLARGPENVVEFHDSLSNVTYWNMPNGGRVIFKRMESYPGNLSMRAVSRKSVYPLYSEYENLDMEISEIMDGYVMNGYAADIVEREKDDRGIVLKWNFLKSCTCLSGGVSVRQLDPFFRLVYWSFNNMDLKEGNAGLRKYLKELMMSPADYTFIFVGNVDTDLLKSYVRKYLAVIPPRYAVAAETDRGNMNEISKVRSSFYAERHMENPFTSYSYTVEAFQPFTLNSFIIRQMSYYLFSTRLKEMMEERGFDLRIRSDYVKYPMETIIFTFGFNSSDYDKAYIDCLATMLDEIASKGVDEEEFGILMNTLKNQFEYNKMFSNEFWQELLTLRALLGKDYINNFYRVLDALTVDDFNDGLRDMICRSTRYTEIVRGIPHDDKAGAGKQDMDLESR